MDIRNYRKQINITQKQAAEIVGMPLRSYVRYENDSARTESLKYQYIAEKLAEYGKIDEEHGVLSIQFIRNTAAEICKKHNIEFCILFGSYAKTSATVRSDVDLVVKTSITGLSFFGLVEEFRQALHKKVDIIRVEELQGNVDLLSDVLKDGIKLYG